MDDHDEVKKDNTDLIQHEIPQNCIKKPRGKYKKKQYKYDKLSQSMTFYCQICSKKYASILTYKVHMANFHGVPYKVLKTMCFGTQERRKYEPRIKKSNTVITKVENQMPLASKNDDKKVSENSTNYLKHEESHQIPMNSGSCVSHTSMTLDNNMALDTSGDAGTNADSSNKKGKSLNVLKDNCTISITANDNINSMDNVDNDTSTLVCSDNNATLDINKKQNVSRYDDKLSKPMSFYCQFCSKKYASIFTFKVHMAKFHGMSYKALKKFYFGTQERRKFKPRIKKSNTVITKVENQMPLELKNDDKIISENSTKNKFNSGTKERRKYEPRIKKSNTVITKVDNQMPLALKNDDKKVSENSTNYMKHEESHQIPMNSGSCVSHKSMTLDDNMALDTSGGAGTNADTSNKKGKSLNVLNDNCTISITANDNFNSMDNVDNDTSTLVCSDNNATLDINNYIVNKKQNVSRYDDKLSQSMTFYCRFCSKKYASIFTFKVHMANFHGMSYKALKKFYFGTQERRKYKSRVKKSNTVITKVENQMPLELKNDDKIISENSTKNKFNSGTKERRKYEPRIKKSNTVITKVDNQMPLALKNDDKKVSENSTNYLKHEESHQIPMNSGSCVSHKSMTIDNNMALDTSGDAGTNADSSNKKGKSLNVLNDSCTISITANDNINSMDIVDNDTSTLVSADNNATLGINNYIVNKKQNISEDVSQYDKLSQCMAFYCQVCSKKYASILTFKVHMAKFHGVPYKALKNFYFGTQERRKYKSRVKKSNTVITKVENQMPLELKNDDKIISENSTKNKFNSGTKERRKYEPRIKKSNTVITKVDNQMPLALKNDDKKVSENSTNYLKHEESHQIPMNSGSCVSHKSMTLDDNMALDTSGGAGTNADTSNKKGKSLNVLNDNCTISITANDNINSMDNVDNDTSTLVCSDNNATLDINKKQNVSRYDDKLSKPMTFYCQFCSKKYASIFTFKVHMAKFHGMSYKALKKFYFGTQERRKFKPRIKKSNTGITRVENQMPLALKNDDKEESENSTIFMKHEESHQIPMNSGSCVSHTSMTIDNNMALDTSGDAGTNADSSNKKGKSLNVLNDSCTISITANDNINSMDNVDNDTSTLVCSDNNATLDINKKQNVSRYDDKLSQSMTFYCQVCSKTYASFSTFQVHMANFHGVPYKALKDFYFGTQKRKNHKRRFKSSNKVITKVKNQMPLKLKNDDKKVSENSTKNKFNSGTKERRKYKSRIKKSNTVITKVENQMPLELKNDDKEVSVNSTNYMKHEESHQIPINSDPCVSHMSMTLDDNMTLDTSDEAGTNADTSNNKNKSLNVLNDSCTISITANDNISSLEIVDNDTSTLDSADNNATLGINNYIIICKTCKQDFASISDFEKHQQYNIYENSIICQNQKDLMACEPKEDYINANYNELFNNEIIPPNIPSKGTWTPDENHLKALNEMCEVQQPFYCDFCKEMCEQYDHYQLNQWRSFNENLKCHVCYQVFSDQKQLELHEREHVNLHFC